MTALCLHSCLHLANQLARYQTQCHTAPNTTGGPLIIAIMPSADPPYNRSAPKTVSGLWKPATALLPTYNRITIDRHILFEERDTREFLALSLPQICMRPHPSRQPSSSVSRDTSTVCLFQVQEGLGCTVGSRPASEEFRSALVLPRQSSSVVSTGTSQVCLFQVQEDVLALSAPLGTVGSRPKFRSV